MKDQAYHDNIGLKFDSAHTINHVYLQGIPRIDYQEQADTYRNVKRYIDLISNP